MDMLTRTCAKALLAVLLALGVLAQLVLVSIATGGTGAAPAGAETLATTFALWMIAMVLCAQVVLVIVWRLTTLTASDAIFDERAFRLVRLMIAVSAFATALALAAWVWLTAIRETPAAVMITLGGGIALGAAFCLVLATMLGLLRRSAALSVELSQVV